MSRSFGRARRAIVAFAAMCASVLPAAAPINEAWHADPDAQFLLDVNLHRLTIGDGVRAYQTPEGACVVLGDFLAALDVPMKIDLTTSKASGWAFDQKNTISIDRREQIAEVKGKREAFAITDVREVPEGWCIDQAALGRWFGMKAKADVFNSILRLDTERKLPIELAIERRTRGEALALKRKAALNLESLPRVKVPYRMWRTPALEFVVSGGARFHANAGLSVTRGASVNAAGEVAAVSYAASAELDNRGLPTNLWARFYRSDPDGKLLGPLHATHVAGGDVPGLASSFHEAGPNGRGVVVTNRPLSQSASFDRTEFRGRLLDGWDAELYRNGMLVAFDDGREHKGEYLFRNIDVMSGDNRFEIILHGPQGQVQRVTDDLNVGQDNPPAGKLWYWAGVRQPGVELLTLSKPDKTEQPTVDRSPSAPEAIVQAQYGIDTRMSVSALVRSALVDDERVTFVEGSVRRSIGPALIDVGIATDSKHRLAGRAQMLAKIGSVSVSASSILTNGTQDADSNGFVSKAVNRIAVGAPVRIGKASIPVSFSVGRTDYMNGGKAYDGTLNLGARIGRFNLASATSYRKIDPGPGVDEERGQELTTELIGTGMIGRVRLRGSALAEVLPEKHLRRLDLDAYFAGDEKSEWDAGVSYDNLSKLGSARISHIRRFDSVAVALTGEARSDGDIGANIRLSFALDPAFSGLKPTRERLASTGLVHAKVFEDVNENGRYDSGEPVEKEAAITTGIKQSEQLTDAKGEVTVGGLSPYVPVAIGIDQSSLSNPALTALRPAQVVVPRPGVGALVEIPLVGGGSIEGFAAKSDGRPYEGLDFDLIDESGHVIATARSDLDGYFVFEDIHYGRFTLKLNAASAQAVKAAPFAPVEVRINRDKPAARIGSVTIAAIQ